MSRSASELLKETSTWAEAVDGTELTAALEAEQMRQTEEELQRLAVIEAKEVERREESRKQLEELRVKDEELRREKEREQKEAAEELAKLEAERRRDLEQIAERYDAAMQQARTKKERAEKDLDQTKRAAEERERLEREREEEAHKVIEFERERVEVELERRTHRDANGTASPASPASVRHHQQQRRLPSGASASPHADKSGWDKSATMSNGTKPIVTSNGNSHAHSNGFISTSPGKVARMKETSAKLNNAIVKSLDNICLERKDKQ